MTMKIGVRIPEQTIGFDPVVLRDFAQAADELGFDYLTLVDHVLGTEHSDREPPFPPGGVYTEEHVFHEPLTLFGFLAACTQRIELTTWVLVLPQRQTALVAKQAAEVALLSNHRLRLGVGIGWNHIEYESLGIEYRARGRRLEEQVSLLRRLWSEPILDIETEFHRIDRAGLNPQLDRPVPIWFGGFSQAQQDRCARLGDGFLWMHDSRLTREGIEFIRARAEEEGRDPDSIGFQVGVAPAEEQTMAEALADWEAAGGTHGTVGDDLEGEQGRELVEALPSLRDQVGEALGA